MAARVDLSSEGGAPEARAVALDTVRATNGRASGEPGRRASARRSPALIEADVRIVGHGAALERERRRPIWARCGNLGGQTQMAVKGPPSGTGRDPPRQPVTNPMRQRQDPLPHGLRPEHGVHQVPRAFRLHAGFRRLVRKEYVAEIRKRGN